MTPQSTLPRARQTVFIFESQVTVAKDIQKKDQICRHFFRGLHDSDTKIEALRAIDSRYVHVIPTNIEAELVWPFLKDSDAQVRLAAANAVGWLVRVERRRVGVAAPQMIALLKDPDWQIRASVLQALGPSGEDQFFAPIKACLNDTNFNVRNEAVRNLGAWLEIQQTQLKNFAASFTNDLKKP